MKVKLCWGILINTPRNRDMLQRSVNPVFASALFSHSRFSNGSFIKQAQTTSKTQSKSSLFCPRLHSCVCLCVERGRMDDCSVLSLVAVFNKLDFEQFNVRARKSSRWRVAYSSSILFKRRRTPIIRLVCKSWAKQTYHWLRPRINICRLGYDLNVHNMRSFVNAGSELFLTTKHISLTFVEIEGKCKKHDIPTQPVLQLLARFKDLADVSFGFANLLHTIQAKDVASIQLQALFSTLLECLPPFVLQCDFSALLPRRYRDLIHLDFTQPLFARLTI